MGTLLNNRLEPLCGVLKIRNCKCLPPVRTMHPSLLFEKEMFACVQRCSYSHRYSDSPNASGAMQSSVNVDVTAMAFPRTKSQGRVQVGKGTRLEADGFSHESKIKVQATFEMCLHEQCIYLGYTFALVSSCLLLLNYSVPFFPSAQVSNNLAIHVALKCDAIWSATHVKDLCSDLPRPKKGTSVHYLKMPFR